LKRNELNQFHFNINYFTLDYAISSLVKSVIFILLASCFFSCGHKVPKIRPDSEAKRLRSQASEVASKLGGNDSVRRMRLEHAVALLDRATELDSNYFGAYWDKLIYQRQLEHYEKALLTGKQLMRLMPNQPTEIEIEGALSELNGDRPSSIKYYTKALLINRIRLDSMQSNQENITSLQMFYAFDLIALKRYREGNAIFKKLAETAKDPAERQTYLYYMSMTRKEVLLSLQGQYPTVEITTPEPTVKK